MCQLEPYGCKIDIWAAGCILAEMLLKRPIFPGEDYKKQLDMIISILGTPDPSCVTNEYALEHIQQLPHCTPIPIESLLGSECEVNPECLDLLDKLLQFDPAKRISIDDALKHPWFKSYHNAIYETNCDAIWDYSFEQDCGPDHDLSQDKLRSYLLQEIFKYRPELKDIYDNNSFYGGKKPQ